MIRPPLDEIISQMRDDGLDDDHPAVLLELDYWVLMPR